MAFDSGINKKISDGLERDNAPDTLFVFKNVSRQLRDDILNAVPGTLKAGYHAAAANEEVWALSSVKNKTMESLEHLGRLGFYNGAKLEFNFSSTFGMHSTQSGIMTAKNILVVKGFDYKPE